MCFTTNYMYWVKFYYILRVHCNIEFASAAVLCHSKFHWCLAKREVIGPHLGFDEARISWTVHDWTSGRISRCVKRWVARKMIVLEPSVTTKWGLRKSSETNNYFPLTGRRIIKQSKWGANWHRYNAARYWARCSMAQPLLLRLKWGHRKWGRVGNLVLVWMGVSRAITNKKFQK